MQDRPSINSVNSIYIQKRSLEVGVVDTLNLTALFGMFLKDVFHKFLEDTGRLFMFPLTAMCVWIQFALAVRQAQIEKNKNGTVMRAIVEGVCALAITTSVVGGFVASSVFSV